jgi:hypothetical protein
MASTNGVTFPESMSDFLANPVDICFGSMPTTSTAPAACLVIEGNAVSANQQIETDLSKKHLGRTTWEGPNSSLSFPLDMLGGLAKANLKVARPKGTSLNEYEASCRLE